MSLAVGRTYNPANTHEKNVNVTSLIYNEFLLVSYFDFKTLTIFYQLFSL